MAGAGAFAGGIIVALVGLVSVFKASVLARWQKEHFGNSWLWATKYTSEGEIRHWYRVGGVFVLAVAIWVFAHGFR